MAKYLLPGIRFGWSLDLSPALNSGLPLECRTPSQNQCRTTEESDGGSLLLGPIRNQMKYPGSLGTRCRMFPRFYFNLIHYLLHIGHVFR